MENHFDPVNEFKLLSILGETYLSFFVFALSFHLSKQNLVEPFLFVTYTIANRQGLLEGKISFCVLIPSITVSTSGSLMMNIFLGLLLSFGSSNDANITSQIRKLFLCFMSRLTRLACFCYIKR